MSGAILTINAGSSSLKYAVFDDDDGLAERLRGQIDHTELDNSLPQLLATVKTRLEGKHLVAVGHRVVQGGADHIVPALVSETLLRDLAALTVLDPLHMPHSLSAMHAVSAALPQLRQVACFDTAFHHTLPPVARQFALPRALTDSGVRRYGFHGLSYEYIASRLKTELPQLAGGRIIAAHLGAGASLCALQNGESIATTTGFSALDGLMMATRCGRLDPGVLLYLAAQGKSFGEIEDILYRRSGLLGVSGISGDVRVLLASDDPHAREALDLFTYHIACEAGALVSALGGLDGLVFTAGIGQHAPAIREAVCARLAWLGIRLDQTANDANAAIISAPDSRVAIHVMATDEEHMIARHTQDVVRTLATKERS